MRGVCNRRRYTAPCDANQSCDAADCLKVGFQRSLSAGQGDEAAKKLLEVDREAVSLMRFLVYTGSFEACTQLLTLHTIASQDRDVQVLRYTEAALRRCQVTSLTFVA